GSRFCQVFTQEAFHRVSPLEGDYDHKKHKKAQKRGRIYFLGPTDATISRAAGPSWPIPTEWSPATPTIPWATSPRSSPGAAKRRKTDLLSAFTYTHDKIGNRLTGTALDLHQHGTKLEYEYDPVYRLLEALPVKLEGKDKPQPNRAEDFAYDPVGNRLAGPRTAEASTYNQDNQLLQGPKYSYQYDRNGNLTGKIGFDEDGKYVSWSYAYDYENRLIRVTQMDGEETKVLSFKYDPFGRRIEKKVEELEDKDEARTYAYVYDNEDIILETLTKSDDGKGRTETTRYLHGPGIDEPLAIEQKGAISYYHADGLGSITTLTDAKGQVLQSYDYSSFGIPKHRGNQVKQPYTYTGREWDEETGLYFYRARYYDPVAGRFIAKDPIGFAGGDVNLYGYVQNNPINWIDSLGLATWTGYLHVVAGGEVFGGGLLTGGLKSVSPEGKVTTVSIMAPLVGVTAGLPVSTTGGEVTFETPGAANPNDFSGYVSFLSANAGLAATGGMSSIMIGKAISDEPFSFQWGFDASTSGFMGWSFPISNESTSSSSGGCK
nr:RHS repeat-associated core domain-containing protein [Desulfobacteraceae bacterium]